ncbi:MAG: hypothetical protein ACXAEE_11095 [Candidatus Thorarchaeota archaeon]|jgi:hypothetical protein
MLILKRWHDWRSNDTIIMEIALVVFLVFIFLNVVITLAREGEAECVEGLDECLKEWDTIKEQWD